MGWTGTHDEALAELQEMGLGIVSARGALKVAEDGGKVDLGCGQVLRVAVKPGKFAIIGTFREQS